ncbi:MAG: hypothetical protein ABIS18_01335 [Actinomycetota bacterium]
MTRRASLPGADELFRSTAQPQPQVVAEVEPPPPVVVVVPEPVVAESPNIQITKEIIPGKPRHEEKVSFYCTIEELTRLEQARLVIRSELRMPADRGRIVRAALAEILDDFDLHGEDSALVRRLEDL